MTDTAPQAKPEAIQIRLFGEFEILIRGVPLKSRTPKDLRVLAYLILKRGLPVDRTDLAHACWPTNKDGEPIGETDALQYLSRALFEIGKRMGSQRWRLQKPTPQTERFDSTGADVDYGRWVAALESGHLDDLERSAPLYRDNMLLAGWNDSWVLEARAQIKTDYLRALEAAACRAQDQDEWEVALRCFALQHELDPWSEDCLDRVLTLLCERRRFAEMERWYNDFLEQSRRQERSVAPGIRARYQELRAIAHRFQNSRMNGRLPDPPSHSIARTADQRAVCEVVRSNRLTTLTGAGGVGKTWLAIAAAEEMREEFFDRVWFVELADIADPNAVSDRVARTLRIDEPLAQSSTDRICEFLLPKEMLLILDNCEHLIDACARFADAVLSTCPKVKLLTTSRKSFGTTYEAVWRVPSLDYPAPSAWYSRQALQRFGAVRLFVQRASRPQAPFQLEEENANAVVRICQRLDGIPLAIELAAVQINRKLKSVQVVANSLDDSLRTLSEGSRTAPARQQTMRAAIAWSYNLLTEAEQIVFARLSVFAGGFTEEGAGAVCRDECLLPEEIAGIVLSLVDQSLVEVTPDVAGTRYHLLQVIREFAHEQLTLRGGNVAVVAATDLASVCARHLNYYFEFAEEAAKELRGTQLALWLERLEYERANLNAALEEAFRQPDIEKGMRFALALQRFWQVRGHYAEGITWCERLLRATDALSSTLRTRILQATGALTLLRGDYVRAQVLFEESLKAEQEAANTLGVSSASGIARTLGNLGNIALQQNDMARARPLFEQSLAHFRELGDERGIAMTLGNLAVVASGEKDRVLALVFHQKCVELLRQLEDETQLALALTNIADTQVHLADYPAARAALSECLVISRRLECAETLLLCLSVTFCLAARRSRMKEAALLKGIGEALRDRHELSMPPKTVAELNRMATLTGELLGATVFDALLEQGHRMPEEEGLEYARLFLHQE